MSFADAYCCGRSDYEDNYSLNSLRPQSQPRGDKATDHDYSLIFVIGLKALYLIVKVGNWESREFKGEETHRRRRCR